MRVRILKALTGIIEGQPLSQFLPGCTYDVDDFIGGQLIVLNAAIEVRATDPAVADDIDMPRLTGGVNVIQPDTTVRSCAQNQIAERPQTAARSLATTVARSQPLFHLR